MNSAFLPPASTLPLRRSRLPTCRRRPENTIRTTPTSLAKFQQQENTESPESETPLENIIPPPALPTLTTLTGDQEKIDQLREPTPEIDISEISTQGAGISAEQEFELLGFFKAVRQEFSLIEWPSTERVVRLTVTILCTLVLAVVGLYFVDGFFYRMSNVLFEGKI